ncbi:3-hydroxyacyl-CoA dehydrogenase family protein [Streptomyces sp. G44]|uniref:3-hydroxyacyl-CoA dehydrogenase family protein n=1 Tax=Streptomyces sp. G44 TaxID=2807632 RepID=UPI00195F53BC|nr:3-hydroxyacyl-CoA dehydrogenase family protein [Streptomyces sp. G44]MBM7169884.1 3-hydroxyacyl-CoA dehydrogenase family protein [Streptomyces sp. G44]
MTRFGIIGGGLMGHGIAVALARAGHRAVVYDADPATLASLDERVVRALERCGMPPGDVGPVGARVTAAKNLSDGVSRVDAVIEAVPERLDVKHQVLEALEAEVPAVLPVWSNTSVLPLTEIAKGMRHPRRLVGVHWWNPPHLMPLVEVAPGAETDPRFVQEACDLLNGMGKTTVRLRRDVPGFIGNRLQFALLREALHLLEQDVCDPVTIDTVMRSSLGLRWSAVGPMENADFIGLDLTRNILDSLAPHLSAAVTFPALDEPLAAGRRGRASGGGLLTWPAGRGEDVARRLEDGVRRNLVEPQDARAGRGRR